MTTYFDGLKVPQTHVQDSGDLTFGGGEAAVTLDYVPKGGKNGVTIIPNNINAAGYAPYPHSLVGKTLTIRTLKQTYDKTNTPTDVDVGSTGGAGNHSHGLGFTAADCVAGLYIGMLAQRFLLLYAPEGGS